MWNFTPTHTGTWASLLVGFAAIAFMYLILFFIWICIIILLAVNYCTVTQAFFPFPDLYFDIDCIIN